jgi:hypothetical protein
MDAIEMWIQRWRAKKKEDLLMSIALNQPSGVKLGGVQNVGRLASRPQP